MTNPGKINNNSRKKRILIAPLDWGLGHATRCIPLIKMLIKYGAEPLIAAEEPISSLLKKEFPNLVILRLKGYRISYSRNKNFFFLKMLMQAPKIRATVINEKRWLDKMIIEHEIDAVISDNRFGLYSKKIPSVFITHQLEIKTSNKLLANQAQKINYKYINRFSECWVPDMEGPDNFAGQLSHPKQLPSIPVKYIGALSRCEKQPLKKEIELLVMISGPEPQRSIFENILLDQLEDTKDIVVLLRGLPATEQPLKLSNNNISVFNHLPAREINELILKAKLVIARCGYSTVMDLATLGQRAILVPTPGQTEQEYLAQYLREKKLFYSVEQEHFSLKNEMENERVSEFKPGNIPITINEDVIVEWLKKI